MKTPILVIFVDAYPFAESETLASRIVAKTRAKVTPGVGYSINVKSELFAGLVPDEVGYFCEWNYSSQKQHGWMNPVVVSFLKSIGNINNFMDRVVHRVVRSLLNSPVYAIPFDVLPYLRFSGPTAYERDFSRSTFLTEGEFERILYSELGGKDDAVFAAAKNYIARERPKRLFVGTAELDGVMHKYGMECTEYRNHLKEVDRHIEEVVTDFIALHGTDARYFIFSDHGMASVKEGVRFDIEAVLGRSGPQTYGYFIDATFLRVWLNDASLRGRLCEALDGLGAGHVYSQEERELHGLKDRRHGDVIYLLDEGKMFSPSFFGEKTCQSMHGYDPELESQQGVFLSNIECGDGNKIKAREIYEAVTNSL